jgi:hypothetical protein
MDAEMMTEIKKLHLRLDVIEKTCLEVRAFSDALIEMLLETQCRDCEQMRARVERVYQDKFAEHLAAADF